MVSSSQAKRPRVAPDTCINIHELVTAVRAHLNAQGDAAATVKYVPVIRAMEVVFKRAFVSSRVCQVVRGTVDAWLDGLMSGGSRVGRDEVVRPPEELSGPSGGSK